MADEFVRKDVYEANMQRIEQRFDSLEKRMDERFEGFQILLGKNLAEFKAIVGDLKSETRVVEARLNSLETTVYWGFAIIAFILAFSAFVPSITEFFRSLRKPSVTMEDVERAIDTAIARALKLEGK